MKGHYGQQVFNSGGDDSSSQPLPLSSPSQESEDRSPVPSSPVSRLRDDRRTHSPILVGAQGRQPSDDDEEGSNLLSLAHNRQYLLRQHGYYNDYNDENDGDDGEMDDDDDLLPQQRTKKHHGGSAQGSARVPLDGLSHHGAQNGPATPSASKKSAAPAALMTPASTPEIVRSTTLGRKRKERVGPNECPRCGHGNVAYQRTNTNGVERWSCTCAKHAATEDQAMCPCCQANAERSFNFTEEHMAFLRGKRIRSETRKTSHSAAPVAAQYLGGSITSERLEAVSTALNAKQPQGLPASKKSTNSPSPTASRRKASFFSLQKKKFYFPI